MFERTSWWLGALLGVTAAGCFDGRDALGLPCDADFQCGNGQTCSVDGVCVWPGGATVGSTATETSSGSGGGSSTDSSSPTTSESTTQDSDESGSDGSTGDPQPMPGCAEGAELRARDISIEGSGNAMSVGVGRFSEDGPADVVVLTRSPARLSRFRFEANFELIDDVDTEPEPMDLAVADLDDDGFDDVVVVDANQAAPDVVVFWGGGKTPFLEQSEYDQPLTIPHSVDAGQMLGGGNLEILVSSGTQGSTATLFDTSGRQIDQAFFFPGVSASPWDTVVVDLNGGGTDEALVVGSNDKGLTDFAGSDIVHVLSASAGSGLVSLQSLDPVISPFGVAAGDLDGDEIPEVLVVGKNIPVPAKTVEKSDQPSEIGLCRRSSVSEPLSCEVWQPSSGARGFNNIRLADLNCDGHLDAVIGTTGGTTPEDGNILIAQGPLVEDFVPTPITQGTIAGVGNELAIADVTGDNSLDVVVPIYGTEGAATGQVRVYSFEEPGR